MTSDGNATAVPLMINGKDVVTDSVFPVVAPDDSARTLWPATSVTEAEAKAAVDAARDAFPAWSATKPAVRRDILLRAADLLQARSDELQGYMKQETGAAAQFAQFNVSTSVEIVRDCAGRISGALTGSVPVCEDAATHAMVVKEPYGVVLGISPWNAPYILGIRAVVYALAAGNTCVLKGSEAAPRCAWAIGALFRDAGLPAGCLNVVFHRPADAAVVTRTLIEHPAVKKINFTGSTVVGRIIAEMAGRNLKPVLMELGGKNNAIVCDDANLANAAVQCSLGAFLHAGQICMSTERILVYKSVLEPFKAELQKATAAIFAHAAPAQSLALAAGFAKVSHLVHDALAKGSVLAHGTAPPAPADAATAGVERRMHPVVLEGITAEMDIYQTESFGPCVSLIAIDSDDEAVRIANDTEYGLSGAVFTENLARGLDIARRIETGAVHINSMSVHDEAGLPHGGAKSSGWGRFNAEAGFNEFLRTKTITFRPSS